MSTILYKFRAARSYSVVAFAGPGLLVHDLRSMIMTQKHLPWREDYDYELTDADTGLEIVGPYVFPGRKVIVRCVQVVRPPPIRVADNDM